VLVPSLAGQQQSHSEMSGMLLGLASGLGLAVLSLALRRLRSADPVAVIGIANLFTGLVLLAAAAMQGSLYCPGWTLLMLAALGAFQIATPYALYCYTLRHLTPQRATILMLTEPIMNPIWVWLVIGEIPGWATFLGGAMIIGGLVVMIRDQTPPAPELVDRPHSRLDGRKDIPAAAE
jgi:drug/metabolite transporter, DME family